MSQPDDDKTKTHVTLTNGTMVSHYRIIELAICFWVILVTLLSAQTQTQITAQSDSSKPSTCPSARGYSTVVCDESTSTAYIFGGVDIRSPKLDYPLSDIWSFDIANRNWKLLLQTDSFYNAFQKDAIALNSDSGEVVLYSTFVNCKGTNAASCGVETWIYDIRQNTFKNITSGTEPSLRWGLRMVYDTESHRAILFGGSDGRSLKTLNDTWAFNFETNTWTQLSPTINPPPHHFAAMVYHPGADRIILFGGYNLQDSAVLNDTWAYDYNTNSWTDMNPHPAPPPRIYHAMAWDSASNSVILFGGVSRLYEPVLEDTWAYDYEQNTWKELTPQVHPSARAWHVMVSTPQGVLLFGGSPQHDLYTNDDTWIYDSKSDQWNEISPCKR